MRVEVENPIDFGAYHYLKKRGYKIKQMIVIVKEYAISLGLTQKIDWLWIPEINKAIDSDFNRFKSWVHLNVENKRKHEYDGYRSI